MELKNSLYISTIIIIYLLIFISCKNETENISNQKIKETCLDCHKEYKGLSGGHDPNIIGCSSCHLGNGKETDKEKSHFGMIKIPGNLDNAHLTCSSVQCHPNELVRIKNSLMTTNSGIISIDKLVFGEVNSIDTFFHINNIDNTAAGVHIKNLCARCHLGYEKKNYARTDDMSRGGGCVACHLNYRPGKIDINDFFHPSIDLNLGNDKCFGCHSRSARISTSYEGWYETLLSKSEIKGLKEKFRVLQDGRIFANTEADVHFKAGLLCIDCHNSQEVMGDGNIYRHSNEAVRIQCTDCHIKESFKTAGKNKFDLIAALDHGTRKYKKQSDSFITTEKANIPLVNSYFDKKGNAFIIGKIDQKLHKLSRTPPICLDDMVHQHLDCSMCHTAWVPTCIGCHTEYLTDNKNPDKKKWYELVDDFGYAPPVMGIEYHEDEYKIKPAIPGMIMTLDKTGFTGEPHKLEFYRYFSPISAHTSSKSGRSCSSCHIDPSAMGYGSGKLELVMYKTKSEWKFTSAYENSKNDNLPQDAWIGLMHNIDKNTRYSVRNDFFPLDLEMQEKVLNAGKCIYCHMDDKHFLSQMVKGQYKKMIRSRSSECRI